MDVRGSIWIGCFQLASVRKKERNEITVNIARNFQLKFKCIIFFVDYDM